MKIDDSLYDNLLYSQGGDMKEKVVGVVREGLPLVANQPEASQDR